MDINTGKFNKVIYSTAQTSWRLLKIETSTKGNVRKHLSNLHHCNWQLFVKPIYFRQFESFSTLN